MVEKEDQYQEFQLLRYNYQRVIPTYVINFKQGDSYFAIKQFFLCYFYLEFQSHTLEYITH